ncbi:MAG: hypothetical protein ACR2OZ_09840 [Verrucomicrobiales bacterium]
MSLQFLRLTSILPMKLKRILLIALLTFGASAIGKAQPSAGGVVYGPRGAFNITAPKGWVLDPSAGAEQDQPCVLYLKNATWETSDPLMYARIARTDTEDAEAFAKVAITDMKAKRPGIIPKRLATGKTAGGLAYFVIEYPPTKAYPHFQRVGYVQLPKAVAYIVLTATEESAYKKHKGALDERVKSILSLEVDYPGKPKGSDLEFRGSEIQSETP